MSDSTQQYILSKPLKPHEVQYWDYIFTKANFPGAFVPLDIPAIQKQLRDIVEKNHCGKPSSIEWLEAVRQEGLDETAKELLAVFGLENKETSNETI